MKRLMAVAQLALCIVFVFCNNGDGQTRPSGLVGQWVDGEVGAKKSMELFKDGTGLAAGVSISWKTENNRFIISNSFGATAFNYKMSGYLLILSLDDEEPDTLVRKEKYAEFKAKREAEEAKQVAEAEAEAKKIAEKAKASISTFKDNRDGKSYKKVTIIDQTWMAENLNYAAEGSKCYDNKDENCAKYGRLYDWSTALKACPAGFHLPTDDEWTALENAIGGSSTAGTKLKSTSGWNKINENGNGTDDYGFSALPGGCGYSRGHFDYAGYNGNWWSATESNADNAWYLNMNYGHERVSMNDDYGYKTGLFSVRCVADK